MNRKNPGLVLLASVVLFSAGIAATLAEEDSPPSASQPATEPATQKRPATPATSLDVLLNQMPKNIWPDPKGNPIREEANKDSRDRWIKDHVLNQEVKLAGFVGHISRDDAVIVFGVKTEAKGTTSISNGTFAIEVAGQRDDRVTIWGRKRGLSQAVCVPKLLAKSDKAPIEPLLALKLSQHVTVTGTIDGIDIVADPGRIEGIDAVTIKLSGCQFSK